MQDADPTVWITSRQYTGRIVTVTNDQIFSNPVYNYSRDFPFIWDQMTIAVEYGADYKQAEQIILDAARHHVEKYVKPGEQDFAALQDRYDVYPSDLVPTSYYRLTPDWLQLTVRFVPPPYGIALIKDGMVRDILAAFTAHNIGIGSSPTQQQITQLPPVRIERTKGTAPSHDGGH